MYFSIIKVLKQCNFGVIKVSKQCILDIAMYFLVLSMC